MRTLVCAALLTATPLVFGCREGPDREARDAYPKATARDERSRGAQDRGDGMMGEGGMGGMMGRDGMGGMMGRDGMGDMMGRDSMGGMMGGGGMMGMMEIMEGMSCDMPDWMLSGQMRMDLTMMRDMHVIHGLLAEHEKIRRRVEDIPNGVRTTTTSDDPEVAARIRTHVYQMKDRVEDGRAIRHMDPVFREIFENHEKIEIQIEEIPGGVRVVETSRDPQVVLLIRQHARRAVSEFVDSGMQRAMRPTPLPEGYGAR